MKPSSATPPSSTTHRVGIALTMADIDHYEKTGEYPSAMNAWAFRYAISEMARVAFARSEIAGSDIKHDMARILQISCDADEVSATKLLHEISEIASKHPWPETVAPEAQEQLTFMSRQAELLDEQGHDVSANVMRDCMKVLVRTMTERDQQTRFKYEANLRADRAEERLSATAAKTPDYKNYLRQLMLGLECENVEKLLSGEEVDPLLFRYIGERITCSAKAGAALGVGIAPEEK